MAAAFSKKLKQSCLKPILTSLLILFCCCAFAQQKLAVGLSTNGLGISYNQVLNKEISVGGSLSYLQFKGNTQNIILDNVVHSTFRVEMPLVEGFVQWHPFINVNFKGAQFKQRFFVKSGLALRLKSEFSTNSTFWDKTMIGSFELTPDQVGYVNIDVKTRKLQPMAAVGYAVINAPKFFLNAELGTYFHGRPKVNMTATGTLHLNTANQTAIQNAISKYKYFPLLKIETGIKF